MDDPMGVQRDEERDRNDETRADNQVEVWYISSTHAVRTQSKRYHRPVEVHKGRFVSDCQRKSSLYSGNTVEVNVTTFEKVTESQRILCAHCIKKAKKIQAQGAAL